VLLQILLYVPLKKFPAPAACLNMTQRMEPQLLPAVHIEPSIFVSISTKSTQIGGMIMQKHRCTAVPLLREIMLQCWWSGTYLDLAGGFLHHNTVLGACCCKYCGKGFWGKPVDRKISHGLRE